MTVSSKLKSEFRTNLYYGKYAYKVNVESPNVYLVYVTKTVTKLNEEYGKLLNSATDIPFITKWRPFIKNANDLALLRNLLKFIIKRPSFWKRSYKKLGHTFRREGNSISFFTNDISDAEEFAAIDSKIIIEEAIPSPAGIKYFKTTPKFSYRVFMKDSKIDTPTAFQLFNFIDQYPQTEVKANAGLKHKLSYACSQTYYPTNWLSPSYSIDYNDSKVLTLLHLSFSGNIGKHFKLELEPKR